MKLPWRKKKPQHAPVTTPRAAGTRVLQVSDYLASLPSAKHQRLIVGLAGRKRCGKSTVAGVLRQHGFIETSFASPIRMFAAFLLAPDLKGGLDWLEKNKETPLLWLDGATPRQIMQTLGTEWGRQMIHPELWVRRLMRMVEASATPNFVISDVRFPNEARAIHQLGGVIVNIDRYARADHDAHASEAGLASEHIDIHFANRGTLAEMRREVSNHLLPHIIACAEFGMAA